MDNYKPLDFFEKIVRKAHNLTEEEIKDEAISHQFEERNIHSFLPSKIKKLFDDGHYSQCTFESFKYLDKEIARLANLSESGYSLMMKAFSENAPLIKLNKLNSVSDKDEQQGYKFIFSGSILGIRNPRGHEYEIEDNLDDCLDHLSFISMLLRKLEKSGFSIKKGK
ncbi:TIGR02391 family protein [Leptospira bandrabouensis]|uniref:TIGR02391 family protein n=1 Tax=Leptospira bandrabouensis TaxID=2484903 RepID=UPI00223DA316|nr:TIGR02391 family protein [Leptospira bandrabouensis]MCW7479457.1 TIGR02391 family protein [Leptospira bandrabouensis]MCW7487140.1 TIGR02391 family protein [Leptospira bandrabouensis]